MTKLKPEFEWEEDDTFFIEGDSSLVNSRKWLQRKFGFSYLDSMVLSILLEGSYWGDTLPDYYGYIEDRNFWIAWNNGDNYVFSKDTLLRVNDSTLVNTLGGDLEPYKSDMH